MVSVISQSSMFTSMFRTILLIFFFCILALPADEFKLDIRMDNAQVEKVILGCAKGATNGFDAGKDIVIPPMGMGTAIVGFHLEGSDNQLYCDLKSTALPVSWKLHCVLPQMPAIPNVPQPPKSLRLDWDPKQIPADIHLTYSINGGKAVDMRLFTFTRLKANGDIVFTATPKPIQTAPTDK